MLDDASSFSSIDDYLRDDSSMGSTKYVDKASLKIKQRTNYLTSSSDEDNDEEDNREADALEVSRSQFKKNWILQRKGGHSPVPVPMVVPKPLVEAKVLIGDKEAEDTSDLSDVPSDVEDVDVVPSLNCMLVESKTVIGGKNKFGSTSEDSFTDINDTLEEDRDLGRLIANGGSSYVLETVNKAVCHDSG